MQISVAFKIAMVLASFGLQMEPSGHQTKNLTQPQTFFRGTDGYIFERKEFQNTNLHIKIVQHESLQSIWDSLNEHPGPNDPQTMAYTTDDGHGNCTIHILDPSVAYEPEYIGHELAHCIYGDFHPHQDVGK